MRDKAAPFTLSYRRMNLKKKFFLPLENSFGDHIYGSYPNKNRIYVGDV